MKVTRRGGPKIHWDAGEASIVLWLLDELRTVAADEDGRGDVWQRLYPDAYEEPAHSAEFRGFTQGALRSERLERIDACKAELEADGKVLVLADDAGDRWIRVMNDLRLALGTRLGITEDWDHEVDPDDPEQFPQAAYLWLTGAQDALVRALMH